MQTVLCVDVSSEPAHAVVVALSGKSLEVLEHYTARLNGELSRQRMLAPADASSLVTDEVTTGEGNGAEHPLVTHASDEHTNALTTLLSQVRSKWTEAVLIVPPYDYLSLNVELPFADKKSIDKVIDLEVQDLVPFEIEDFLVSHLATAPVNAVSAEPRFDVHVGIIPRIYMRNVMQLCRKAKIEPIVVTTPTSILAAPYHIAPDFFQQDSAVICERGSFIFLVTCIDGQLRADRTFSQSDYTFSSNGSAFPAGREGGSELVVIDLKLSISAAERRYGRNFEKIYLVGSMFSPGELQQSLGRPVEKFTLSEFVKLENEDGSLAALSSLLVRDQEPAPVLSNFRVNEFSYSPQLTELFRGLRAIGPYAALFLACFCAYLIISYSLGAFHEHRLRSAMHEQLRKVMPDVAIPAGQEFETLQGEVTRLRNQLNDVAPLSSRSPLDLLSELAQIVPKVPGIALRSVKIRDTKVIISGTGQEYGNIEDLGKALRQSKVFKRVKEGESSGPAGVGGVRTFSYEAWVDES
ncbi:MAG: hypothetical protein J5J00_13540 [Deltaproteobacteria bacterium]|nr:hypothetical protein [Deltaproteobacteria bacterium]